MTQKPNTTYTMYELLKRSPDKKLRLLFECRNMAYTANEKKKIMPLSEKVYRELSNAHKIKDLFYQISSRDNLMELLGYMYTNGGEIPDNNERIQSYSNEAAALENLGILFRSSGKLILPLEYFFVLGSGECIRKFSAGEDTLLRWIWSYSSEEIKAVLAHINNTYRQSFDTSYSKTYCAAMAYKYIVENKNKIYDGLTKEQKKILRLVLEKDNRIEVHQLFSKYPLDPDMNERRYSWSYDYIRTSNIIGRYNSSCTEKSDVKKLFLTGFLMLIYDNHAYKTHVSIPEEMYDAASKEYLEELKRTRNKIESAMYAHTGLPGAQKPTDIVEDIRKFLAAISSPEMRLNKNGTLSNKSCSLISELTGFDSDKANFFFMLGTKNSWTTEKWSEYLQSKIPAIASKAIALFDGNPIASEIQERCIATIRTAYQYSSQRQIIIKENNLLDIALSALTGLSKKQKKTDAWIDTAQFLAYLGMDRNFKAIMRIWEEQQESGKNTLDTKYPKDVLDQIYRDLLHAGVLEIVKPACPGLITHMRLSGPGKTGIRTHEKNVARQKEIRIIIQPNNEIMVSLDAGLETLSKISGFAYPKKIDRYCIYHISKESVMRSVSEGFGREKITGYLEKHSGKPLPSTVKTLVDSASSRYGEIGMKECAGCLVFSDPILAQEILADRAVMKELKEFSSSKDSQKIIMVKDKSSMDAIYKLLQKKGYGIKKE
ncbi:MAG: helicase-associated domain-containing protein [archaeon]